MGTPLGHEDVPFSYTLFSELRAGNLPACFGHINKERKLFLDVGRDQAMLPDHNDNIIQNLNRTDKHYYQQLMLRSLKDKGLIDCSLRVEHW